MNDEFLRKVNDLNDALWYSPNPIVVWWRELKRSLYNLYYFFPAIWRSRDWDSCYIYDILATKLEKMYQYRTKNRHMMHYVGEEKVNRRILECAILARRLSNIPGYEFAELQYNAHDENEDFLGFLNNKSYCEALNRWSKKGTAAEKWHRERLFYLLNRYIERFWD